MSNILSHLIGVKERDCEQIQDANMNYGVLIVASVHNKHTQRNVKLNVEGLKSNIHSYTLHLTNF